MIVHEHSGLEHSLLPSLCTPVIQYTDDTLIMLPACPFQFYHLKEILDTFADTTELHINFHKSTFVTITSPMTTLWSLPPSLGAQLLDSPNRTWGRLERTLMTPRGG
jgi:hypothetical protein